MPAAKTRLARSHSPWSAASFAAAALVLIACTFVLAAARGIDSGFVVPPPAHLAAGPALDEYLVDLRDIAHAVATAETPEGDLLAVWYQGTGETAPDVRLLSARRTGGAWSPPEALADAATTRAETQRYVRFVGNATLVRHPSGEYWLFYVSVAVGGWSGAELNLKRSADGRNWGPAKRLYASPMLNRSTLVRAPPLILRDGRIALPAYDEMASAVAALLVVDRDGDVVDRIRIGGAGQAIQPWVVALGEERAVALMRTADESRSVVWRSETRDGGRSWSPMQATSLVNPASAVAAIRLDDGTLLAAGNLASLRVSQFALALSRDDGVTWESPVPFLNGTAERRGFRYPWLTAHQGALHLFLSEYALGQPMRGIRHMTLTPPALKAPDAR